MMLALLEKLAAFVEPTVEIALNEVSNSSAI